MTQRKPVLCTDTPSLQHPELLGLEGERLEAQSWLTVFTDAEQARRFARASAEGLEVWVAGSDQMEGINLAAAMKSDRADAEVNLLSFATGGSLLSRARAAGIDGVLDKSAFLERYRNSKAAGGMQGSHVAGMSTQVIDLCAGQAGNAAWIASPRGSAQNQTNRREGVFSTAGGVSAPLVQDPSSRPDASSPTLQAAQPLPLAVTAAMPTVVDAAKSYVMTVIGAGGGTGKSTVSTLIACCCQSTGRKTVIVDADLQFGDIAYLCGCESPLRIDDLMEAPLRIEGLSKTTRLPAVVAAPERMERSEMVSQHLPEIISLLRQRFEVVIVNTGPTWSDSHVQLMELSTNVLFVIDQRPSSIRACKHALDLCSRCGVASKPFLFAVNRCSRKALFSSIDVSCALKGAHVHELSDGGRAVEELLGTGQPLDLVDSGNALSKSVAELVDSVVPAGSSETKEFVMPQKKRGLRPGRKRT